MSRPPFPFVHGPAARIAVGSAIAFVLGLALWACELVTHSGDFVTEEAVVEGGVVGCPSSQTTCVDDAGAVSCANLSSDNANCGVCGNPCGAALVCSGGVCQTNCSVGETTCEVGCVDLTSDPENCGTCQNACKARQVCSAGACAVGCTAGLKLCGSTCVADDYGTECGLCADNATCPAGNKCTLGICVPTETVTACRSVCDGGCVDPLTDPDNCGSCGRVCPNSGMCVNGVCNSCVDGFDFCDGICVNVSNSAANCGACGMACATGSYCVNAAKGCVACPLTAATVCDNACVNTSTDSTNCGKCFNRCATGVCLGGKCTP